jgi:hypothetical protein
MTERWRKKLGDLDRQGPSDEVFDLAKQGPRHTDEPMPGMRPSTRIATAVAAFAVFALAISVFAIPALRMQSTTAGGATGLFPLWPSQTTDQLKQLQSDADAGNASWALDPKGVASDFTKEVLGWRDVTVAAESQSLCAVQWGPPSPAPYIPIGVSASYPSLDNPSVATSICDQQVAESAFADVTRSISTPTETGGSESGFVNMYVTDCNPSEPCNVIPLQSLTLYQPLEQGDGGIWAILYAENALIKLSTVAGQNVRSGASVSATFVGGGDSTPTLGYASCGSSAASSQHDEIAGIGERISMQTDLTASANCAGAQPGYVWAARGSQSFADPTGAPSPDPLAGGAKVLALTAVPVAMTFPDQQVKTAPPNGGSVGITTSTPTVGASTTYTSFTDSVGWTIDVPDGWSSMAIASNSITGLGGSGQEFRGDGLTVDVFQGEAVVLPADDSTYPLNFDTLFGSTSDGALVGMFRGNGEPVSIRVTSSDASFTPQQDEILRHMVSSISFPHLQPGETWHGWTDAGPIDPTQTGQWVSYGTSQIFARWKDGERSVLGPFPPCSTGGGTFGFDTVVAGRIVISIHCPDGDVGQWDFAGDPLPGNPSYFDASIQSSDAVLSWDAQLLVHLEVRGSTPTPQGGAGG